MKNICEPLSCNHIRCFIYWKYWLMMHTEFMIEFTKQLQIQTGIEWFWHHKLEE